MKYPFLPRKKASVLFSLSLFFAFYSLGGMAKAQDNSPNALTSQKSTRNGSTQNRQNRTGENGSKKTATGSNEQSARSFTATAYSLRGRTASGRRTSKGIIAADHHVLPLGTRVKLDAGNYSGEYVVADTGGKIRGSRIDIWVPDTREARRFGRRPVKLTVLEYGARKGTRAHKRH